MTPNDVGNADWIHLKPYGYAPGGYMNQCHRCLQHVYYVDKRAWTCRTCAEIMFNEDQQKIERTEMLQMQHMDTPKEHILTHPTYDHIDMACRSIVYDIGVDALDIEAVVGLTRGGLIPGVMMSHMLNLPMEVVSYSSKSGAGDNKCYGDDIPTVSSKRILIIDDIADSGKTLLELVGEYERRGHSVYTATIYYKESSVFTPDYYVYRIPENSPWIIFPWESK